MNLRLILKQIFCSHRRFYDGHVAAPEGLLVRRVCVRCKAVFFEHQKTTRRKAG